MSGLAIVDGAALALIDGSRVGRLVDGRAGGLAAATSRSGAEPAAVGVSGPGRCGARERHCAPVLSGRCEAGRGRMEPGREPIGRDRPAWLHAWVVRRADEVVDFLTGQVASVTGRWTARQGVSTRARRPVDSAAAGCPESRSPARAGAPERTGSATARPGRSAACSIRVHSAEDEDVLTVGLNRALARVDTA